MTTNIDRAAEVIADALRPALSIADGIGHDLARILADAGVLAPDLPEPRMIGRRGALGGLRPEWEIGFDTVIADGPHVWGGRYRNPLTPEQARNFALALLAAADHAEGVGRADS